MPLAEEPCLFQYFIYLAKKKSSLDEASINEAQELWDGLCQTFKMENDSPRLIKLIEETKSFGSNGFQKRNFVLVTDPDGKYPQHITLEFHKDHCGLLDNFKVGDDVKVGININGREV